MAATITQDLIELNDGVHKVIMDLIQDGDEKYADIVRNLMDAQDKILEGIQATYRQGY